jgi:hypothetical protein
MTPAQYLECLHQLRVNLIPVLAGLVLIIGAFRRWKWLVDPPLSWSPYYSQARAKEMFGSAFVLYFTYFLGLALLVGGGFGVYREAVLCHQLSTPPPHWVRPSS